MKQRPPKTTPFLAAVLVALAGCGGESSSNYTDPPVPTATPLGAKSPPAKSDQAGAGERTPTIVGLTFTLPEGWRQVELTDEQRNFVDARFEIPTSAQPLMLTVTSAGGGIEANIDRWLDQMQTEPGDSPTIDDLKVGGVTARWVDIRGTFRAGMTGGGGGPQKNWRLIGVAIPHSPRDVYLKLTGPRPLVAEIEEQVRTLATSARPG